MKDPDLVGYIPDNTNLFICVHCSDKRGVDLADINEIENTAILYSDDWKGEVGPCVDCGTLASDVRP